MLAEKGKASGILPGHIQEIMECLFVTRVLLEEAGVKTVFPFGNCRFFRLGCGCTSCHSSRIGAQMIHEEHGVIVRVMASFLVEQVDKFFLMVP